MYASPTPDNSFDKYDEPKLHMEALMKAHLLDFNLSRRIVFPLVETGIKTLGDLVKETPKSLRKIPTIGKGAVETIERFLAYNLLTLDMK